MLQDPGGHGSLPERLALVAMGKAFGKPWRLEEKAAALAAWAALRER